MRKLITIILVLAASVAFSQTTYQLNYDSIRVGKTAGNGATSLYGKTYLKNATEGTPSDSVLTVRNGRVYKIAGSAISSVGFLTYVFSRTASDISGYEQMPALTSYTIGAADTATVAATTTPAIIQEFATNTGFPNTTLIPAGVFNVTYQTQKNSGSQSYYTYAVIYKRNLAGTETAIATTNNSSSVSANTVQSVSVSAVSPTDISVLTTDRIVVKVFAVMVSGTANISIYYDDATDSRLAFPSALVDATNFVPYNGAVKDLVSVFSITGDSIKRVGGTGAQFLMGNGTVQDTTAIQTVANFFPKGDTRYAKGVGNAVLTTGNQSIAGTKTFSSTITGTVASGTAIAATGTGTGIITVNATGSQGRISTSDNKLVLAGASGDASLRAVSGGQLEIPSLAGMGDVIAYANTNGLVGQLGIGTGLSLSGGVLSATGSGSGSIGGSGTSTYIPVFTGSAAIGNSIMTSTGSEVKINGSAANLRIGSNASDYGTFNYSGGNTSVRNDWASTSAQLDLTANGVGMRIFGTGNTHVAYTTDQGYKFAVNGTTYFNGNSIINGSSTATSFSGAGTGLTGTASGLNIGGNAATATTATTASNSTLWNNQTYSGTAPSSVQYALVYDNTNAQWRLGSASNLQSFLGLGSNAYTSTTYVSGISVASANGLTGSSSGGATPTLTLASTFNSPIVATVGGQFTGATTTGTGTTAVLSASPALTGNPTAPTQTQGDNSTKIATTAYVDRLGGGIITSGRYDGLITGGTNVTGTSYTVNGAHYRRIGNEVTVTGRCSLTTSSSGASVFYIDLPIASNLSAGADLLGAANADTNSTNIVINADTGGDRALVEFTAAGNSFMTVYYNFTYTVL